MGLSAGDRLGPFEIVSALGAGGMGEVYRARDARLHREVALKVLPDAFVRDPDRLARFRREAQLLAALNHPNIATIHGLEESSTPPALVLELVEGPTLADRVVSDALPLAEALPIAIQIVNALEAAHAHGIIHRDLKPSNIKVRPDGTVKVLDFGLAKVRESAAGPGAATASQSPTITSPVVTGAGMLLGTAAYMAPEQAKGRDADRRSDMWAFGCVLYEMLTGRMAFGGPDVADTLAAVLKSDPDWRALPADTPESVRRLLRRCLAKSPNERLADASAARLDLDDARLAPRQAAGPAFPRFERVAWAAAILVCVFGGGAWLWLSSAGGSAVQPEMRVDIATPTTTDLVSMALSPDGNTLAFIASSEGRTLLWLRSLVTGVAQPLPDTDGASFPFWSPDNQSIGFFASDRVYRIDADGGGLKVLATAPVAAGGTWSKDGVILFPPVPDAPLSLVRDTGGEVSTPAGSGPEAYRGGERFPQFLPDGRNYIYYMAQAAVRGVYAGTLDGPERRRLFDADAAAIFLPPARILFVRAGKLYVQGFVTTSLSLTGQPVEVASGIALDSTGGPAVSASTTGSIVFRVASRNRQRQLMWVDRAGRPVGEAFPADPENAVNPALSQDGRQLVLNRTVDGNADIFLIDLERRGAITRITTAPTPDVSPRWSPTGRQIYYGGRGRIGFGIVSRALTAAAEDASVWDGPAHEIPLDVSRDGRFLLFRSQTLTPASIDLWALPLSGGDPPTMVTATVADERGGSFSPDGRWIVFESNESGHYDVFVQPFRRPGERTLVSPGGGSQAQWAPGGSEVFYVARDGRLMAVRLRFGTDGRTVEPASPEALFPSRLNTTATGGSGTEYAVAPDGKRFLINSLIEHANAPITLVLNLATPGR